MFCIDSNEKLDWLLNGLENGRIAIGGTNPSKEDFEEMAKEIAKHRASINKNTNKKQDAFV